MKPQTVKVRNFTGISTLADPLDTPPGTLGVADGVNTVPKEALSFGPNWGSAWGQTALGTAIATALSGATASRVHFVTLDRGGYSFLIAWEITAGRPRGIWQVAGVADPSLSASSGSSVTATNDSIHRDKTNSLPWYGSVIQNEIWLGNGTDTNLAWASGALGFLGPATQPADALDPAQFQFPPCTCFIAGSENQVYAAGNVTYPLRIWCSEPPSINYPLNHGIKTTTLSYLDLKVNATAITGFSSFGRDLIVHLNVGPPMIIAGYNGSAGGWKLAQQPTKANASAINPNCTRDNKIFPFYFGSDFEFYKLPTFRGSIVDRGYAASVFRDEDIETKKAPGKWQSDATKPISGTDYAVIFDEKNGRYWAWLNMSAGTRMGCYCYDSRTASVTGPWRYPDFLSVCKIRSDNLNGCQVAGITRDGAFLFADVAAINSYTLPAYSASLPAGCAGVATPPSPSAGLGYVGVDEVNSAFTFVLNGQTLNLANPWATWSTSGTVTPTIYFNNARIGIIELGPTDIGTPALQKEILALRTIWERNSVVYVGVYCESNGYRYGAWRGLQYPSTDWVSALGGEGSTVTVRLVIVSFNSQLGVLRGLNIDWFGGVEN